MCRVVTTADDVLREVQGKALVAIDGRMAVGKTTLARSLCEPLRASLVQTDTFIEAQWGRDTRPLTYVDLLDLEALEVRVRNALTRGPVLLDGICVLDTIRRLRRAADAHVLVSAVEPAAARFDIARDPPMDHERSPSGVDDRALLDDRVGEAELLAALRKDWGSFNLINERSLVVYFKRFGPHRVADVVLLRA